MQRLEKFVREQIVRHCDKGGGLSVNIDFGSEILESCDVDEIQSRLLSLLGDAVDRH